LFERQLSVNGDYQGRVPVSRRIEGQAGWDTYDPQRDAPLVARDVSHLSKCKIASIHKEGRTEQPLQDGTLADGSFADPA
jgi:hypothetical protein